MKYVFLVAGLFTLLVVGGVSVINKTVNTTRSPSETLVLQNHTVTGNITDDLKTKDAPVTAEKQVLRLNLDPKRVVYFSSAFTQGSVALAVTKMKELASKSNEPIWLLLNSPGGSVVDGAELISQMEQSSAPVNTICMKLCASMAAMTHSYGAKRYSLDRAILMYHPATAGVRGQVPNMLSLLKTLTRYIDKMNSNIVNRSKLSKEEYESLVAYELWIDSEDALSKGLIDGIVSVNVPHESQEAGPSETFEERNESNVSFQSISPYAKDLWKK